jgi:hypothetical protein
MTPRRKSHGVQQLQGPAHRLQPDHSSNRAPWHPGRASAGGLRLVACLGNACDVGRTCAGDALRSERTAGHCLEPVDWTILNQLRGTGRRHDRSGGRAGGCAAVLLGAGGTGAWLPTGDLGIPSSCGIAIRSPFQHSRCGRASARAQLHQCCDVRMLLPQVPAARSWLVSGQRYNGFSPQGFYGPMNLNRWAGNGRCHCFWLPARTTCWRWSSLLRLSP